MKNLEVWYARLDIESCPAELRARSSKPAASARREKAFAKARTRDSMSAFSKLTAAGRRRARIVDRAAVDRADRGSRRRGRARGALSELHELMRVYRRTLQHDRRVLLEEFELTDFARKVVGVGSVGTRAWIALLLGRDETIRCSCR